MLTDPVLWDDGRLVGFGRAVFRPGDVVYADYHREVRLAGDEGGYPAALVGWVVRVTLAGGHVVAAGGYNSEQAAAHAAGRVMALAAAPPPGPATGEA